MSEKRFYKLNSRFVDIEEPVIYDNFEQKALNIEQSVELLNNLHQENEHLLQSNRTLGDNLKQEEEENANEYNALLKENEQLRNELDKYKIVILQFVGLLVENGIIDSSVKEEVDELLEELSGDGV